MLCHATPQIFPKSSPSIGGVVNAPSPIELLIVCLWGGKGRSPLTARKAPTINTLGANVPMPSLALLDGNILAGLADFPNFRKEPTKARVSPRRKGRKALLKEEITL